MLYGARADKSNHLVATLEACCRLEAQAHSRGVGCDEITAGHLSAGLKGGTREYYVQGGRPEIIHGGERCY